MSVVGLGDRAVVGELIADRVSSAGVVFSSGLDNTDTVAPTTGFHPINSVAAGVNLSLPDGKTGDVVEFVHTASGNPIVITPVNLRGPALTITFSATAGGYCKLVFISSAWYILARSSDAVANATAVANLPAVA
jgi:hypothetical protein